MIYSNLFKFGLLISCLLGNSLAMDTDESQDKPQEKPKFTHENIVRNAESIPDIGTAIASVLPLRAQLNLKQTSKGWYTLIEKFQPILSCQYFDNINININTYFNKYCIFGIHSGSFYIFLPCEEYEQVQGEENEPTKAKPVWNQTIPWIINGNSLEAKQLPTFETGIIDCLSMPHPDGIILFDCVTYKHPNLLTNQNDTSIQIKPLFQGFEEAKDTKNGLNLACNTSHVVFIRDNLLSCYDQRYPWKNFTLNLGSNGYWFHNFGEQFLVSGSNPEKLWCVNPSSGTYKKIPLPENFILTKLASDQDNLLAYGFLDNEPHKPYVHYIIEAISNEKPSIHPVFFLPKGYYPVGSYLKNNYVFSVACLMNSEQACEKSGVLVIYDWQKNQKCFQKYMPKLPLFADFVGTSLIIKTTGKWTKNPDYDEGDTDPEDEYIDEDFSLIGINLKNWLQD